MPHKSHSSEVRSEPKSISGPQRVPSIELPDRPPSPKIVNFSSSFGSRVSGFIKAKKTSHHSSRSSSASSTTFHEHVISWTDNGYATLPASDRFNLLALTPNDAAVYEGVTKSPSYRSISEAMPHRAIPVNCGFTLECESVASRDATFELKELGPALIQAGKYRLRIF